MSEVAPNPVERRRLLRTGVVMAGVAAGAVAASAGVATRAEAATGDGVVLGVANEADQITQIAYTATDVNTATLGLSHANSGPTLFLDPEPIDDWEGELELGDIINTTEGPFVGRLVEGTLTTDFLATGYDLALQPVVYPVDPTRLLDTRSDLSNIVGASSGTPFDANSRLKAFQWIDVAVEPADDFYTVEAAFFNLTATQALSGGNLTAYPPGDRPNTSTLNFQKALSIANGTFVSLGVAGDAFVVRLYTTATVHVILDYTGLSVREIPGPAAAAATNRQRATRPRRSSRRLPSALGRRGR